MAEDWRHGGFGIYIHWPFCAAKCPYCDFNSHVAQRIDMEDWRAAYLSEIARGAGLTRDRVLNSVYFGGGTPSLMSAELVGALIDEIARHWRLANDVEITLEANPSSVEAGRFAGYRAGGVNRVSLGIQALDDADLRALGRLHNVETALRALDLARSTFDRVSFDLIYARQGQSLDAWATELDRALGFGPDHLSLYQLTIEDGTAFGERARRGLLRGLPPEDLAADMFFLTQDRCEAAGLSAYEVSNHAKPDQESRHNLIYWRGGDYLGIGPGAHGRLTLGGRRTATWTELVPEAWLNAVRETGSGDAGSDALSAEDHAGEYLMMSLRTSEGTDLRRLAEIGGAPIDFGKVNDLAGIGLVELGEHQRLRATAQGRAVLNAVITELLPG